MDNLAIRRKRLIYQSRHRGTQEGDLLLGGFAERRLDGFGGAELDQFEALMGESDADLIEWVMGRAAVPAHLGGRVFKLLVEYKTSLIRY